MRRPMSISRKQFLRPLWWYGLGFLVLLLSWSGVAAAGVTGTIVGTVSDPSGGVIPDARVLVRNQGTNLVREARTNARGDYTVALLPPGVYEVSVEAASFSRGIRSDVDLKVDETVRVDMELPVGQISDRVVVREETQMVQTDTSSIGHVVDNTKATSLPLNERRFLAFTLLVPGVQLPSDGSPNSQEGGSISVSGAREQSNTFLLNGVDNNDQAINQFVALPPIEAIQEFKVQSSNSSAEFGRSGGAQINVVLKSGTNQFHGSVFELVRNRHLDAKNFFDKPDCTPSSISGTCDEIPRFDRSQFGGSLGGGLRKDRTFFFVAYEGLRMRQADTRTATVPSQGERAAALAAVPPAERNPAGEAIFNLYPAANSGNDLSTSNSFVSNPAIRQRADQAVVKVDERLGSNGTLSVHYALFDENRFNPFAVAGGAFTRLPGFGATAKNRGQNAGLTWTQVLSNRLVNEARLGFNRFRGGIFQENIGVNKNAELGFPTVLDDPVDLGFPNVETVGFDGIGEPVSTPQDRHDNTLHFSDSIAWNPTFHSGRHQFRFGGDYRHAQMNIFLDVLARGLWIFAGGFSGNPLVDLLRGTPDFALAVSGDTAATIDTNAASFFLQDNMQLTPRFVLNLGLRYEYVSPPVERFNRFSVPDLSANALTCSPQPDCQFILVGTQSIPRSIYPKDANNFAPRIGFAWRPLSTNRLVVRSAYGIFYDVNHFNVNILPRFNPPFFAQIFFLNRGTDTIQTIFNQGAFVLPPIPEMISPTFRDGYMQHWNLNLQYELLAGLLLDIAYVGSKGTNLVARRDLNQPRPGVGAPPFPQFASIELVESRSSSIYHALQFRAEQKVRGGLTFLASYTWSRSIDDSSALFPGGRTEPGVPQDSANIRAERGLSNFHAKHRFVLSHVYNLPFASDRSGLLQTLFGNWQLTGIWTVQSGRPLTINRSVNQSGTFGGLSRSDRPDSFSDPFQAGPVPSHPDPRCHSTISQGGRAADAVRTPTTWFNPCAFAVPGTPRFGTLGRGTVIGPDFRNVDLGLTKLFPLRGDEHALQFRVEFFNIFNRPNFDVPNRIFDSATFGSIQSANAFGGKPPRQVQLGLRYFF